MMHHLSLELNFLLCPALLNEDYFIHGTKHTNALEVAKSSQGFDMDGRVECFYSRGVYFAHRSRYSHHYAFRSSDLDGNFPAANGPFFHLLIVSVLRGAIKKQPDPWSKNERQRPGAWRLALGDDFDSVEGGPHMPLFAGPGEDDSLMCVVYKSSQAMAEFVVTYKVLSDIYSGCIYRQDAEIILTNETFH
jgi:hypothetical protein